MAEKVTRQPGGHRFQKKGFSFERLIRFFFASNAGLTIVILVLIISFLLKEGLGFFPGYRRELENYRVSGMEFVDIARKNLTSQEELVSVLNRAYHAEVNSKCAREMRRYQEASAVYNAFTDKTGPTKELIMSNAESAGNAGMLSALNESFRKQKEDALANLPEAPSLTAAERAELTEALRNETPETVDSPPLITRLTEEFTAAQAKHSAPLAPFRSTIDTFESAGMDLSSFVSEISETASTTKEALSNADMVEKERKTLLDAAKRAKTAAERERLDKEAASITAERPDTKAAIDTLLARRGEIATLLQTLRQQADATRPALPASLADGDANRLLGAAKKAWPVFLKDLSEAPSKLDSWNSAKPVPLLASINSFLFGKDWITGGEWQDFYGILPLAAGSLMIAIVALIIAIPTGISAAIYTNQFAKPREQAIIKPVIEFIQAIPSVVLGFMGILVVGEVLRKFSNAEWLQWLPGFPIDERLNIFTAGCLLALMSIPTIFSLAEDALNNVPSAYSEASEALGASRVQTTFRVMIPAAFSGILAAILLGLGRVIGETMVVLLVAGNRIKIPDFSAGIGAFFQPAHTLTGIIAQELGEVPFGSVHYRALFVVGIVLFAVVLIINASAHHFVNRARK